MDGRLNSCSSTMDDDECLLDLGFCLATNYRRRENEYAYFSPLLDLFRADDGAHAEVARRRCRRIRSSTAACVKHLADDWFECYDR